jgi:Putative DNA-binding domain
MKNLEYQQQIAVFLEQHWPHSVYENNYTEGHRLALRRNFTSCALLFSQWQADDVFNALLRSYVLNRPTAHWDINRYGAELPDFIIAQQRSPKGNQFPWPLLAEIAALEYALASCYYGNVELNCEQIIDLPELLAVDTEPLVQLMEIIQQQHPYTVFERSLMDPNSSFIESIKRDRINPLRQLKLQFLASQPSAVPRLHLSPATLGMTAGDKIDGNFIDQPVSVALHATKPKEPARYEF